MLLQMPFDHLRAHNPAINTEPQAQVWEDKMSVGAKVSRKRSNVAKEGENQDGETSAIHCH